MSERIETVKAKVKKLLELAKSDNEHEANLALTKAQELMEQWALDEMSVRGELDREGLFGKVTMHTFRDVPLENVSMYSIAGRLFNVETIMASFDETEHGNMPLPRGKRIVYAVGSESDLAAFHETVKYIAQTTDRLVNIEKERMAYYRPGKSYWFSFKKGILSGMHETAERLAKAQEQKHKVKNESFALVLVDNRKAVDREFRRRFPRARTVHNYSGSNGVGFNRGQSEGRKVGFHKQAGDRASRGRLGS